jgi:polyisoprenyl-phosphate glycosyltransferase
MIRYSLIVPVYGNEQSIPALLAAIDALYRELEHALQAVFVVDGSPDNSYAVLQELLPQQPFPAELVLLSRNFGSFSAIRMGLSVASGPYYAVMAADLQEPPELVQEFFQVLREGEYDVTLGTRAGRDDPPFSRYSSQIFWSLYRRFIQPEMPPGGIDMFGCNQQVRDVLVSLHEANSTLVGLLIWLGFRRKMIPYQRRKREHGKSGWTLRKKVAYMLNSAYAFTDLPIAMLLIIGVVGLAGSTAVSAIVLVAWLFGQVPVRGYTPLILALMMSTSLLLVGLGIVGGYVWRAFENTKGRPQYIPIVQHSFGRENAP